MGTALVAVLVALSLLALSWRVLSMRSWLVRGYSLWHLHLLELCSAVLAVMSHATLLYFVVYAKLPATCAYLGAALWRRCVCHRTSHIHSSTAAGHHLVRGNPSLVATDGGSSDAEAELLGGAVVAAVPATTTKTTLRQARSTPLWSCDGGSAAVRLGTSAGSASAETTSPMLGDQAPSTAASFTARAAAENAGRWLPFWIGFVVVLVAAPHVVVYRCIPEAHRQSKEIILYLARFIFDVLLFGVGFVRVAKQTETALASAGGGGVGGKGSSARRTTYAGMTLRTLRAVLIAAVLYVLCRFFFVAMTFDTLSHLRMGVTQDGVDVCALEGLRLDPQLAKSWVWPALTHRRLLNFYTGSESCAAGRRTPPLSLVVEEEQLLVVSSVCPDGKQPHIYLHRPERSEFSGASDVKLPETERGNLEYHRQLEALYGTAEAAAANGVIVHRDAHTKLITSVELDPALLAAQPRVSRSVEETEVRRRWPRTAAGEKGRVLQVRLGRAPAYTVYCAAMDREEYHLWPLDDALLDSYSAAARGSAPGCMPRALPPADAPEPAGNVLVLLFDAVSRQEIRRSLPKFSKALRALAQGTPGGHVVVEPQGAMTLGINTAANLVPFLAGVSARVVGLPTEVKFESTSFMSRSVFTLAKAKYGDTLSTAFTTAFCHDLFEYLMGHAEPSSGAGGRVMGVDRYYYQPFCHLDYSGYSSNYKGAYSIVTRCMAGEEVWKHSVNYTERLLRKQLRDSGRARGTLNATAAAVPAGVEGDCAASPVMRGALGKHFFHVIYMTEGHEGAHSVMPLLDDTLTRFLSDLRSRLRFFDDPRNTFVMLADHGNHMGHYHAFTNAGEYERGTPPLVLAVSPEVLSRVDRAKGRPDGTSLANLNERARHASTSLDVYPTLADLLNINVTVHEAYRAPHMVQAASFFDARDPTSAAAPVRRCAQFSTAAEAYPCTLDFCVPRV